MHQPHAYRWTGTIPCTGVYKCIFCGYVEHKAHALDYSEVDYKKPCLGRPSLDDTKVSPKPPIDTKHRIAAARLAIDTYRRAKDGTRAEEDEADARDLITDLLHLMSEKHKAIEPELRTALNNFTDEQRISPYQVRRIGV